MPVFVAEPSAGKGIEMNDYNYKVVAVLKSDLSENERLSAVNEIKDLQSRLKIVNIDNVTYCKAQPINGQDDFGAVAFFSRH